ncbi:DNA-directed RNA polymerase subunit beta' [Candidatus Shapirobacteria bacterium]|nr:DNA-directed RNA polymerase subunit beta' [Candidatus Shapirobacteria bacterium]
MEFDKNIVDFRGLQIKLASPEEIFNWSHGEVTKPETINYRTWRPEKDGLFCEKIFGPTKDYECYCGKYRKIRFKGIICEKCGVEVASSRVRRERMGHISLVVPAVHVWFLKNNPLPLTTVLGISQRELEAIIYFARYLVTAIYPDKVGKALNNLKAGAKERLDALKKELKEKTTELNEQEKKEKRELKTKIRNQDQRSIASQEISVNFKQKKKRIEEEIILERESLKELYRILREKVKKLKAHDTLSEEELFHFRELGADGFLKVGMGAESILEILKGINLKKMVKELRGQFKATSSQAKKKQLLKKIRLVNGMVQSGINPAWMILQTLPVVPPELRPMVQLTGGRFATSDLNDLYRRVINRNNRLKRLISLGAPEIILRNEKRMLQEAVDMLIDVTKARRRGQAIRRPPRSLSDLLRGKKGRFRKNLLGKRVDYSGRSVIVVGPQLKLNECGLPREIALEIFRPFILRELMLRGLAPNIKSAKNLLDHRIAEVYEILEEVVEGKLIFLNRAPTLHKLSVQAFKPVLTDSLAIRLHPCVCKGFNADFDGDQMGVHLPLSSQAQKEAKKLMISTRNLLKPSDGRPVNTPSKEMVVGCYFATSVQEKDLPLLEQGRKEVLKKVSCFTDENEVIRYYEMGVIHLRALIGFRLEKGDWILTTPGRVMFNLFLPKGFDYINEAVDNRKVGEILMKAFRNYSRKEMVILIDKLKDFGFWGMNLSGISLSIFDCGFAPRKQAIIKESDQKVAMIEKNYHEGLITEGEKGQLVRDIWLETTEAIASSIWSSLPLDSPIRIMGGAGEKRASPDQIKQISGMRGLVVDPLGNIVALPTKSSFREGLSVFEYVTGARGSRKGLTDTALKTADAGYLTRRLVDASHTCLVREEDCGARKGLLIENKGGRKDNFEARISGRVLAQKIVDPKTNKELIKVGEILDEEKVALIRDKGIESVLVRSPLKCRTEYGVCRYCYGWDLSSRQLVSIGTPVGVVAAQSIGEPGTQLTLRTKHSGGVIGLDVTQGLPRVQELLEARNPKASGAMSEIKGKVSIKRTDAGWQITIRGSKNGKKEEVDYLLPQSALLKVKDGQKVSRGTALSAGSLSIKDLMRLQGLEKAQQYLLDQVQGVYESQGIGIHDKHFEVIIREMSSRVRITASGDTDFLAGSYVEEPVLARENQRIKKKKGSPAKGRQEILGLIQAALTTDSWLSAASFQETTNVLTQASLLGREDRLIGLKENVIIGRLIPTTKERVKIS